MRDVASEVKTLEGQTLKRSKHALAHLSGPISSANDQFDPDAAQARLAVLLGPSSAEMSA